MFKFTILMLFFSAIGYAETPLENVRALSARGQLQEAIWLAEQNELTLEVTDLKNELFETLQAENCPLAPNQNLSYFPPGRAKKAFVSCSLPGRPPVRAMFKPGEQCGTRGYRGWGLTLGHFYEDWMACYKSEVGAFRLDDQILHFRMVPYVAPDYDLFKQNGSLHYYVNDTESGDDLRNRLGAEEYQLFVSKVNFTKLRILDFLMGNDDRNPGNWLVAQGFEHPIAIDHGMALRMTGDIGCILDGVFYYGLKLGGTCARQLGISLLWGPRQYMALLSKASPDSLLVDEMVDVSLLDEATRAHLMTLQEGDFRQVLEGWVDPVVIEQVVERFLKLRQLL